jgi:hypothetical protein
MRIIESTIERIGSVQEITLSKKSTPGDGTHACGKKGEGSGFFESE